MTVMKAKMEVYTSKFGFSFFKQILKSNQVADAYTIFTEENKIVSWRWTSILS